MAYSPPHYHLLTDQGVTRIQIRYVRSFSQTVDVRMCALHGIDHDCDHENCWPDP